GCSPAWRAGYPQVLAGWAASNPVCVLSLVEPRLWPAAGLGARLAWLRVPDQPQPNARWKVEDGPTGAPTPESTPPIPVVDLSPRSLCRLADTLTAVQRRSRMLLLDPKAPPRPAEPAPADAADTVQLYRSITGARIFDLLTYLSAAPLVDVLIERVRQTAM